MTLGNSMFYLPKGPTVATWAIMPDVHTQLETFSLV